MLVEGGQHMVDGLARAVAYADAEAGKFAAAKFCDNAFDAAVSSCATFAAEAESTKRQIEVVVNKQYLFGSDAVFAGPLSDCAAAKIHERLGLLQPEVTATNLALPEVTVCDMLSGFLAAWQFGTEPIDDHKADIMSRICVLWARIAQAYYEADVVFCRNRYPSP